MTILHVVSNAKVTLSINIEEKIRKPTNKNIA